ncbi:hypothetical protein COO60DRAFT_906930 [Scenedesmus sp. NREL 46B-D3]|nr:hypothetical protein COO60DRAFT_906930 [Scenedesmus sp. NREL 46B-D3]
MRCLKQSLGANCSGLHYTSSPQRFMNLTGPCSATWQLSPSPSSNTAEAQQHLLLLPSRDAWRPDVVCRAGFGFGGKDKAGGKGAKDCPCGSGRLYSDCCQRFHRSSSASVSAAPQQLIAARYSAFVKKDFKFLRRSSHPDNPALKGSSTADDAGVQRQCSFEEDLAVTFLAVAFLGLDIYGSSTSPDGSSADVEYAVSIRRKIDSTGAKVKQPQEEVLRERATLVKDEEGRWLLLGVQALDVEPAAA